MCVRSDRIEDVNADRYSQSNGIAPDEVNFIAGAALTLFVPTLLFCLVINQLWPLYVMACDEALGVVLGFVMFRKPSGGFLPRASTPAPQTLHAARVTAG